jgi:hypothetical protein
MGATGFLSLKAKANLSSNIISLIIFLLTIYSKTLSIVVLKQNLYFYI